MCACGLWNLPAARHTQACVTEGSFPPHCVPGGAGTHRAHSQDHLHQSEPRHPAPHRALPHCATCCHVVSLTCSSGADGGWARRGKQLWSWMADPTHFSAAEPSSENEKDCVCALKYMRTFGSITNNCVCQYGLMVGILPPIEAQGPQDGGQAH